MRSDRKETIIFIVILLVLSMGIGYAYLTTTLSIDGISDIDSASWDVHWANIEVTQGSVSGDAVTQAPTISANGSTINYHIRLKNPGDFYEFTVDAVNAGTLDAMVDNILLTESGNEVAIGDTPDYLIQTICYAEDNAEILPNQLLEAGTSEKFKFRLEYKSDFDQSKLPDEPVSLSYSFKTSYKQANKNAFKIREYVYATCSDPYMGECELFRLGNNISEFDQNSIYDNYQDAIDNFVTDMFLRHKIVNGKIAETYIGFLYNGNIYYLRGGDGGASFETNKETLLEAIGEDKCHYDTKTPENFTCTVRITRGGNAPYIIIKPNGEVTVGGDPKSCCDIWVYTDRITSQCYYE